MLILLLIFCFILFCFFSNSGRALFRAFLELPPLRSPLFRKEGQFFYARVKLCLFLKRKYPKGVGVGVYRLHILLPAVFGRANTAPTGGRLRNVFPVPRALSHPFPLGEGLGEAISSHSRAHPRTVRQSAHTNWPVLPAFSSTLQARLHAQKQPYRAFWRTFHVCIFI